MSLAPTPLGRLGDTIAVRPTRVRYLVLGAVVAAYFITYMVRVMLSNAEPTLEKEFGFDITTFGWILFAYQIAYAGFQIPGGWFGDKVGPRTALAAVVAWYSLFTLATIFAFDAISMGVLLFLIGVGEAGAFPIANRALSRWMLPSERAIAQGTTHAGSRLGGALTPIFVIWLMTNYGWRSPFVVCSIIGLAWAILWLRFYRNLPAEHRMVNEGELSTINAALGTFAKGRRKVPWGQILRNRQLWLLACMYFCYGYDIGVFLSRFPKYLSSARGIDLDSLGIYASMPLFAGLFGDILGGGISDHLLKKTGNVKFSRRIVSVVGFAMAAVAVALAAAAESVDVSIAWFCLAVFSFELTVGVSWAITLDIGGEFAGSVSAVMNTLGNIGASIAIVVTGYLARDYGWGYAFGVIAALAVIAALLNLTIDASRRLYRDTEAAA